ncbi:MAG: hypothetical protein HRT90_07355 [Candidatus Margulisbacteria bacterium]|nr:hypothetical protein [Candidatus Margulisiibacteriota bacterium]
MYTDILLKEKWDVQKKLSKAAKYDTQKLIENARNHTEIIAKKLGLTPHFAKPNKSVKA